MTVTLLEKFLESTEGWIVDFKKKNYDIGDEKSKASFVKDILSMANTERDKSAFIIIGVSQKDKYKNFENIDTGIDDNPFQTLIRSCVEPIVTQFLYYTFPYKGYTLGVFEIPRTSGGPYYSNKNISTKLKAKEIYYRQGTTNSEANDLKKAEISNWMKGMRSESWRNIMEYANGFDDKTNNYILIIGPDIYFSQEQLRSFSRVSWSGIIDISVASEDQGLYKATQQALKEKRGVHLITKESENIPSFYENNTLFWIMAGGERAIGQGNISRREWNKNYAKMTRNYLGVMRNSMTKPIVIISIVNNEEYIQTLDDMIQPMFDLTTFTHLILSIDADKKTAIEDDDFLKISVSSIDLYQCMNEIEDNSQINYKPSLPAKNNTTKHINETAWLQEELTVVYKNIESSIEREEGYTTNQFYKGHLLRWDEMNPPKDIIRDIYISHLDRIKTSLFNLDFANNMIELDYSAGAGATTFVRRLSWDLHTYYPTVIVDRISVATESRIKFLHDQTELPILIFIDTLQASVSNINELKRSLEVANIKFFMYVTKRHLNHKPKNSLYSLSASLQKSENNAFKVKYLELVEQENVSLQVKMRRKKAVEDVFNKIYMPSAPFFYGLAAYEDEFITLEKYVGNRLELCTEDQRVILLTIAIAYYYGSAEIPSSLFKSYFNMKGMNKLENILNKGQMELIFQKDWQYKPMHYYVAKEIIMNLCLNGSKDRRAWKNRLKESLFTFIDIISSEGNRDNILVGELTKIIFFDRDNNDEYQELFSNAISDLPSNEAKREVFQKLVDSFPNKAHTHGHFSRFYNYVLKDYNSALEQINIAVTISPRDYNLLHIKGTCIRSKIIDEISNKWNEMDITREELITIIERDTEYAEECFIVSRELKPSNMYAYESQIMMLVDCVKRYKEVYYPSGTFEEIIKISYNYWCSNFIDKAREILNEAERVQNDLKTKFRKEECKAKLAETVGDLSLAIQGWSNLLSNKDVFHPPIRRNIVNAYKEFADNKWVNVPIEKKMRALKLLEENIEEESENSRNIIMWIDLVRRIPETQENKLDLIIERLQYWNKDNNLLVNYYSFVFFTLRSILNNSQADVKKVEHYQSISAGLARNLPRRKYARDWYDAAGNGVYSLVDNHDLREKYPSLEFDDRLEKIDSVIGRIQTIDREESGTILLSSGLQVHFNPAHNSDVKFYKGKDSGEKVSFKLAFSYEGLRAYQVKRV